MGSDNPEVFEAFLQRFLGLPALGNVTVAPDTRPTMVSKIFWDLEYRSKIRPSLSLTTS